ncbi:MAG: MFS transporter [Armatimonadetes bacterium]|nr:MFS transporter [Armatimonadota bacterium]
MTSDLKKLYLFHLFNSIALTVVASFLFLDKIFLRIGLNMAQFGIIKGNAFFIPLTLNLLLAPLALRLNIDRQAVAVGYLFRVAMPYLLFLLPFATKDTGYLTLGCAAVTLATMIFPHLANNSLYVLCKSHIPPSQLGRHMSLLSILWGLPAFLLAIPCGWYIDLHARGGDAEFYGAFFHIFLATTVFQIAGSWAVWRMNRPVRPEPVDAVGFRAVGEPFQDACFRPLLITLLVLATVTAMVTSFINPYLMQAQRLTMSQISALAAAVSIPGYALMPLWGRMADRFGGRSVLMASALGMAAGMLCLTGQGMAFVIGFAVLTGLGAGGFFGTGLSIGQQYLALAMSDERKSNIYIAVTGFATGCGIFIGSIAGGALLEWLKGGAAPGSAFGYYRLYFTLCALGYLGLAGSAALMRGKRHAPTLLSDEAI